MADLAVVEDVLRGALAVPDASLVIFRRDVLVEFKTEALAPGLVATVEAGHRGWQVGPFDGHHCHLNLLAVRAVLFDAEPVSCQAGRINYTVWFLGTGDCGNPYRPDGLFSVTLNAPYDVDGAPRMDVIGAVVALYRRVGHHAAVEASPAFVAQLQSLEARGP